MINKLWSYSTKEPIQRVGVVVFFIGLLSMFSWILMRGVDPLDVIDSYYQPDSRDSFFFHLYLYLIPIGLLMSWGYSLLLKIKEWIIKGNAEKKPHSNSKKNLHFKTTLAAFQFAVPLYSVNFSLNIMNVGIIQNKTLLEDGSYHFLVQIANMHGTVLVSGFNDKYSDDINLGNLVYWKMTELVEDATEVDIPAVGAIVATLYPEFNPNTSQWKVRKNLTE